MNLKIGPIIRPKMLRTPGRVNISQQIYSTLTARPITKDQEFVLKQWRAGVHSLRVVIKVTMHDQNLHSLRTVFAQSAKARTFEM